MNNQPEKRTTDLDKIKHGAPFAWGEVIKIHEIGNYTIVETEVSLVER